MFKKSYQLFAPEPDAGGGGGITPADARVFVSDFVSDPKSLDGMPDDQVVAYHGKLTAAISKHAPKMGANGGAWYDGFKDPVVKDWIKAYGNAYPDPEAVALKALNLEKFVGAEKAGRGVVLPKPDAKDEEWLPILRKIGAPEKPEGYKVPEAMAKDPTIIKMRDAAHKMGMPSRMFDGLVGFFGAELKAQQDKQVQEFEGAAERELQEVLTEWGSSSDAKQEAGRRAAAMFTPHENKEQLEEILTKMEGALGTKFVMNFWANIGEAIGEHGFVQGDDSDTGIVTPAGARLRIEELKKDKVFGKKILDGDADAKAEWDKLHKIAFGAPASK